MNDFPTSDGPYGGPHPDHPHGAPGTPGAQGADGFPVEGHPGPAADGHGSSYGYPPPAPGGWGGAPAPDPAPGGYPQEGYRQAGAADGYDGYAGYAPQGGHAQGGYDQHGYPQPGQDQGGFQGGYDHGAYVQGGYAQDGFAQPQQPDPSAHAASADAYGGTQQAYGHGSADGTTYVPEPLTTHLPSDVDPGTGFGASAGGGTWGGQDPARQPHGAAPATDSWAAAPAPAPAWGTTPGGAPGYAPGQDAGVGSGYGRQPSPAPRHAPGQVPGGHAPGPAYSGPEPETVLERTAALPVVELEEEAAGAAHRTGSPIIPPGIQPAGLTAALGLLLAGGAAVGRPGLAVVLVLLQAVTAAGWFRLNGMWPARQGIVLAFLSGVTADIAVLAVSGGHGPVALLGTLGVWLLLVLVLQLRHHGSADERLASLTATSASTLLTVVATGYLVTATSHAGTDPVVVGTIAVAAATLVRAVRLPGGEPVSLVAALVVAAVTGALTGPATGFGSGHAVLLAAAAGACALIGLRVASYDWPSRFVHFTAGVALPLTAAAPVVYALGVALT
ncbi:hypothetical protein SAMN05216223_119137 [Actinacidiphila yanglinensis]|uniref:Uncharacterized protein n=1 Tax=Actinacidiphila yanglinensis TaxID=310779 RepID=A0A1H6DTT9_9ACTN|nr:hypothetical protein [Actinacidiphila yanglinensis]SEG88767.1 hypothetical protein SAMN05216223_119137 [Actinacidiphila yanglinensis]